MMLQQHYIVLHTFSLIGSKPRHKEEAFKPAAQLSSCSIAYWGPFKPVQYPCDTHSQT